MPTPKSGRPRTLDRNKKSLLCNAVSRGATMGEAAQLVGVSLRTVQREARMDPDFDQQLRLAHNDTPDPLAIMHSAARTHWRAAAWLLERENPEDYGRKPARCCTPLQFDEALKTVIEAALRLTPPENRAKVYAHLTDASETAFKAIFPNYGPCGGRLVDRLPSTPLADAERLNVIRESASQSRIPDPVAPVEDAPDASPERAVRFTPTVPNDERAVGLGPTVPNDEQQPLAESLSDRTETPPSPCSADLGEVGSTELAEVGRAKLAASQSPAPAPRLPWRYILRAARTSPVVPNIPISANIAESSVLSHLSPKTRSATEFESGDSNPPATPPHSAPSPNPVE